MEFGWWNLDFAFFHLCEKVLTNVGRSKQLPISRLTVAQTRRSQC